MSDPTASPGPRDDRGRDSDPGSPPGMPRWVKVFVIVGGALLLLLLVVRLAGIGGDHGPGRHGLDAGSHARTDQGEGPWIDRALELALMANR